MNANRVLLLTLSERTSAKGNRYMSGWLGRASVVAFPGEDDKHGNPTWDVFVSTPEPRPAEVGGEVRPRPESSSRSAGAAASGAPAKPSARPVERGAGWRGSQYRRSANGARRAPAAGHEPFYEDSLGDIGR